MKLPLLSIPAPRQTVSRPRRLKHLGLSAIGLALGALPASAATYTYTGLGGDGQYTTATNWLPAAVPNTSAGDVAVINNGAAVTYTPGGDLTIKNGGILQVTSGSFTQAGGNNYIQLNGNGSIVVNGGTFNQGTASSTPFNLNGTTGNVFQVTAGAVNINTVFAMNVGLTFSQSGGAITVAGNETDFSNTTSTLSGGTFTTKLITGVNGAAPTRFDISGGVLNLTGAGSNGIYGGGTTRFINFTPGSTGQITFSSGSTTIANVQSFINQGVIEYNSGGTGTLSNFNITSNNGVVTLALAVPEPSTFAVAALGVVGLMGWTILRRARPTV